MLAATHSTRSTSSTSVCCAKGVSARKAISGKAQVLRTEASEAQLRREQKRSRRKVRRALWRALSQCYSSRVRRKAARELLFIIKAFAAATCFDTERATTRRRLRRIVFASRRTARDTPAIA